MESPPSSPRRTRQEHTVETRQTVAHEATGQTFATPEELLRFDAAQWAVTPGQSAVLYDGEVCLGGGVIAGAA